MHGLIERTDDVLAASDRAAESIERQSDTQALIEEYAAGVQQVQHARVAHVLDQLTSEGSVGHAAPDSRP
jgi:hypothetical protein